MAAGLDKKELWIDWTHDALGAYSPDEEADMEDSVDDAVEFATKFADSMLDEYEKRFESGGASRRKRGKTRRDEVEDEEDE